jgi:hypothetical protein
MKNQEGREFWLIKRLDQCLDRERSYSLGTEVSTLVREKKDSYTYDGECSLIFDGVQERDGDLD